jgi:hypothetical protein
MIINLLISYWVILNALNLVGGVLGWLELRKSREERGAVYLSRILLAEAFRSGTSIIGIRRFAQALLAFPYYVSLSVVVTTLLCGAIWGWLLYSRGVINGKKEA